MAKPLKDPIIFFNRYTQHLEQEAIYGEPWLRWAYETRIGKRTAKLILKRAWFSAWYGWRMDSPSSRRRILPFIQKYQLKTEGFEKPPEAFQSFNDFFARKLKPEAMQVSPNAKEACFPAEGRHLGFQNFSETDGIYVKGQQFNLASFLDNEALAQAYAGGSLVFSRLCPVDYHRFHFPVSGSPLSPRYIKGDLLSVNPIALRKNIRILCQNRRIITEIHTAHFGTVLMAEIGATCVGHIHQTFKPNHAVRKGSEKGFFKFGGSATLLLFQPNTIQLAPDLLEQTQKGYELYAKMGDSLGTSKRLA